MLLLAYSHPCPLCILQSACDRPVTKQSIFLLQHHLLETLDDQNRYRTQRLLPRRKTDNWQAPRENNDHIQNVTLNLNNGYD